MRCSSETISALASLEVLTYQESIAAFDAFEERRNTCGITAHEFITLAALKMAIHRFEANHS